MCQISDIIMDEYEKYAALVDTIQIEDITSDEDKQFILRQIRDNSPEFTTLRLCDKYLWCDELDYWPENAKELAWLGIFLGGNTIINELYTTYTYVPPPKSCDAGIEVFRRGLGNNKSIQKVNFCFNNLSDGRLFSMLDTFFKNNNRLKEVEVEECNFGSGGVRQFSLALGGCQKSLKYIDISGSEMGDGQVVDIITALSMHPQLEYLDLSAMNIGRNECTALSTLLRHTTTKLQKLRLIQNDIDDVGLETLKQAVNGHALQQLDIGDNDSITIQGWKSLSTILELPGCKLEILHIDNNNIGDEGALVFANALAKNSSIKLLGLGANGMSMDGWRPFEKLLCDTSSINNTYLSNHTLNDVGSTPDVPNPVVPTLVVSFLHSNRSSLDKRQVPMRKIIENHSHFNMEPFFEWELKVLPIMMEWFIKAAALEVGSVETNKLESMYDFIKEFPMLYIEPMTRKEITEYTTMEEQLRGQEKIGEIQECRLVQ